MISLESVKLFYDLPPHDLKTLHDIAREIRFPLNARIFCEGDAADGVYIVKKGLVEISALVNQTAQRVFSRLGEGAIFGEMAVIEQEPRSATAIAIQETDVYFIPHDEMFALLQHSPALAFNILKEISHRLREFDQFHLREIVQAERLAVIGNFARSIIHDLKTPLTIIGLSAEIGCAPNVTPEKRVQSQERIRKQVWRINDMVGDILEFTRSGRAETAVTATDYSAFISELLTELQTEVEAKDVQVELQNQPPSAKMFLDIRRLRRVFFNLVHNATDVMPEGGKIFLRFSFQENEMVTEIEDTGPGIPPQIADALFQPFVTHGKAHGTGLGLSICKKIVEDHNGRIWARHESGHGAIFCFLLPIAK